MQHRTRRSSPSASTSWASPPTSSGAAAPASRAVRAAGAAALVIQAYRKTHGGANPGPGTGQADPDQHGDRPRRPRRRAGRRPAEQLQGGPAGRVDPHIDGSPRRTGSTLLLSSSQLNAVGAPGQRPELAGDGHEHRRARAGRVAERPDLRPGPERADRQRHAERRHQPAVRELPGRCRTTTASSTSASRPGQQRLVGSIAWPGDPATCLQTACKTGLNGRVRLILVDPRGRFAAHSLPQGPGNFGSVDVREPDRGHVDRRHLRHVASVGGTNGTVPWRMATERSVPFGSVSPGCSCWRRARAGP